MAKKPVAKAMMKKSAAKKAVMKVHSKPTAKIPMNKNKKVLDY